jgi:hypothetical protein
MSQQKLLYLETNPSPSYTKSKAELLPPSNHNQYLLQHWHSTMHLPAVTAVLRPPVLRRFIRENPLGTLTTAIKSPSHPSLQSTHIPWVVDVDDDDSEVE